MRHAIHAIRLPTFLKMCQIEVFLQNPQHYENRKTGRVARVACHHAVSIVPLEALLSPVQRLPP